MINTASASMNGAAAHASQTHENSQHFCPFHSGVCYSCTDHVLHGNSKSVPGQAQHLSMGIVLTNMTLTAPAVAPENVPFVAGDEGDEGGSPDATPDSMSPAPEGKPGNEGNEGASMLMSQSTL